MKLLSVEARRKSLVTLELDNGEDVLIDKLTFMKSRFKKGDEISDDELKELLDESEYSRAKDKAMYLLGFKSRSKRELVQRLSQDYPHEISASVADKMEELGLLDDEKYAEALCKRLINEKGYAARRAVFELTQKGIDRSLAERIAYTLEQEISPAEKAAEILRRKYPDCLTDEKIKRRAYNALMRAGYDYSVASEAFNLIKE